MALIMRGILAQKHLVFGMPLRGLSGSQRINQLQTAAQRVLAIRQEEPPDPPLIAPPFEAAGGNPYRIAALERKRPAARISEAGLWNYPRRLETERGAQRSLSRDLDPRPDLSLGRGRLCGPVGRLRGS